jgi:hypothetical protein
MLLKLFMPVATASVTIPPLSSLTISTPKLYFGFQLPLGGVVISPNLFSHLRLVLNDTFLGRECEESKLMLPISCQITFSDKITIFWDITPCSPFKVNWCFGGTHHLPLQGWRISQGRNQCEAGSKSASTLKMEVVHSSETSVDTQRATRCYITEDSTLQSLYICSLSCFVVNNMDQYQFISEVHNRNTRQGVNVNRYQPSVHLSLYQKGTYYMGITLFNSLPLQLKLLHNKLHSTPPIHI